MNKIITTTFLLFVVQILLAQEVPASKLSPTIRTVYVQTNKNGYLIGEKIWFSAYLMNHGTRQLLADTQPLYLQLFAPDGKLVEQEMIFTHNGRGWGYISLPEILYSGVYRLRAFTRMMMTFPDAVFEKEVILQHPKDNSLVIRKSKSIENTTDKTLNISVLGEKEIYNKREKVILTIKAINADGTPAQGSFSLSVVDALRQIQNPDDFNILSYSSKTINTQNRQGGFFYEKNPLYTGTVKNQRTGKIIPEANLVLMVMDSTQRQTHTTQGNVNGRFVFNSLLFDGEKTISYQVNTKKGKAEFDGLIEFDHITNYQALPPIQSERTTVSQSTQNEWQALLQHPDGEDFADPLKNILLEEVAIKAEKPKEFDQNSVGVIKIYANPDYSVTFDDKSPRFTNIFEMLIGTLPGVQASGEGVVVRGINSFASSTAPLFLLDGMPLGDPRSVNPSDVVKIDLLSGASAAIFGSNGANGVIIFYTRRFGTPKTIYPFAKNMKMKGFQEDTPYKSIDYGTPSPDHKSADNRVSIYWKPDVVTDKNGEATITFYTADIAGLYNIVVEGMTLGNIGRGTHTIRIK